MQEARIVQSKEAIANQPWLWQHYKAEVGIQIFQIRLSLAERMERMSYRYRSGHGGNDPKLIPTHVYHSSKLDQNVNTNLCRLCQTNPETDLQLLFGYPRLTLTEQLYRHNNVFKCLFFALLQRFGFIKTIPHPHSGIEPKPATKTDDVQSLWDIPIDLSGAEILTAVEQGNRLDMVVIDQMSKNLNVIECSCPWVTNTDRKDKEKYQEVRAELQRKYTASISIKLMSCWM